MYSQFENQFAGVECCWPLIGQSQPNADDIIVFRSTGFQSPLFIIPDFGGELYFGTRLTSIVHHGIPVYGLRGRLSESSPFETIQGTASHYVTLIRSVQPRGPYRLIGWLHAGILAYEIASQLLGLDEHVEFVGLLDSWWNQRVAEPEKTGLENKLSELSLKIHRMFLALIDAEYGHLSESNHSWEQHFHMKRHMGLLPSEWSKSNYCNWLTQRLYLLEAEYHAPSLPIQVDLLVTQGRLSGCTCNDSAYHYWDQFLPRRNVRRSSISCSPFELFNDDRERDLEQFISKGLENNITIQARNKTKYNPVVKLRQPSTSVATLVCIPGAGDSIFRFMDLVDLLPHDWQIMGLQPRGFLEGSVPHSGVEAAARFYLDVLQLEERTEPVYLLGHSFGGWVAFEIAAQLEKCQFFVDALVLADSDAPTVVHRERTELSALMSFIRLFEKQGQSLGLIEKELSMILHQERLIRLHHALIRQKLMPAGSRLKDLEQIYQLYSANIRTRYYPASVPSVKTHLMVDHHNSQSQKSGWRHVQPEISCRTSTGNHITLLKRPHVQLLADLINHL